jgi:glycosyltransferase involved in cell wall biosynthesis
MIMPKDPVTISIVCPCFNEQAAVKLFLHRMNAVLTELNRPFEMIMVNDGSTDDTLDLLLQAKTTYAQIRVINLSRNFGKEAALSAGLDFAQGEVIIPIDADLQDPPELIKAFISKWQQGYDVVLAKRANRSSDSFLKRLTAFLFYKLHSKISHTQIPDNVGDFRLITRKVLQAIQQLPENQRFMKGIFAWVGFKTTVVEYKRAARTAGKTSFHGWSLWNFALEGITSFSTFPLRVWLYVGSFIALLSFSYGSFIVLRTLIQGVDLPGYASMLTTILFLGGIQLIGIGVLGEYLGRTYKEAKRRPRYIVDDEY